MTRLKYPLLAVLRYSERPFPRSTVSAYYLHWRAVNGVPVRCDNAECVFHTAPLEWNGAPVKPIVDHITGNKNDNTPQNLQLLCPNCDSQLETRGGRNAGRIQDRSSTSYAIVHRGSERRDAIAFLSGVSTSAETGQVTPTPGGEQESA